MKEIHTTGLLYRVDKMPCKYNKEIPEKWGKENFCEMEELCEVGEGMKDWAPICI